MFDRYHVTLLTTMPDHGSKFLIVSGIEQCVWLPPLEKKKYYLGEWVGLGVSYLLAFEFYMYHTSVCQQFYLWRFFFTFASDLNIPCWRRRRLRSPTCPQACHCCRRERNAIQSRAARTFATWGKWWACVRWGSRWRDKEREAKEKCPTFPQVRRRMNYCKREY